MRDEGDIFSRLKNGNVWSLTIVISPRSTFCLVLTSPSPPLISAILNTPAWTDNVSPRNSQGAPNSVVSWEERPRNEKSAGNEKELTVYFPNRKNYILLRVISWNICGRRKGMGSKVEYCIRISRSWIKKLLNFIKKIWINGYR